MILSIISFSIVIILSVWIGLAATNKIDTHEDTIVPAIFALIFSIGFTLGVVLGGI